MMSNKWVECRSGVKPAIMFNTDRVEVWYVGARLPEVVFALDDVNWDSVKCYRLIEAHSSDNTWIKFTGVSCPVDAHSLVEVRTSMHPDRKGHAKSAGLWCWGVRPDSITHYRVVEDQPTPTEQSSGGDNDYYVANITNPKRLEPCRVECEDVIQALGMTFGEGEAFKAIWRGCAARMSNGKPGDTAMRNAEKVIHYGEYMKRDAQNEDGL